MLFLSTSALEKWGGGETASAPLCHHIAYDDAMMATPGKFANTARRESIYSRLLLLQTKKRHHFSLRLYVFLL